MQIGMEVNSLVSGTRSAFRSIQENLRGGQRLARNKLIRPPELINYCLARSRRVMSACRGPCEEIIALTNVSLVILRRFRHLYQLKLTGELNRPVYNIYLHFGGSVHRKAAYPASYRTNLQLLSTVYNFLRYVSRKQV